MSGGAELEFEGSWYCATILDCGQKNAKVRFESADGVPTQVTPSQHGIAWHSLAWHGMAWHGIA